MLNLKLVTVAAVLIFLTACQTIPEKTDVTDSSESEPSTEMPKKETRAKKEPETAIDSDVLYLLLTGEMALQRKKYDIALEAYLEAAKRVSDPRIAEKATQIGTYLDNQPQTEKAISVWLEKDDDNMNARRYALSAALNKKNMDALIKHLNVILKNNPAAFEEILFQLESVAKTKEELTFIDQTLDILAKQHPKVAAIPLAQSLMAVQHNKVDLAMQRVQQALKLQPNWEKALDFEAKLMLYFGKLAFKNKQFDQAIVWFDKVKQGNFVNDASVAAIAVLIEQKKYDAAQTRMDVLLSKEERPKQKQQLQIMQAELQSLQKNYDKAFDILTQALSESPKDQEILYARALTAEKMDDLKTMEADLLEIISQLPDDTRALNALGYALTEHTTRYEDAEKYLEKAVKLQPEDAMIGDSYGWLQFKKGNLATALKYLQAAYKKLPEAEIAAHLAETLWTLGRKQEAEKIFKEALKKSPNDESLLEFQQRVLKPVNSAD